MVQTTGDHGSIEAEPREKVVSIVGGNKSWSCRNLSISALPPQINAYMVIAAIVVLEIHSLEAKPL